MNANQTNLPIDKLNTWLAEEEKCSGQIGRFAVLATVTPNNEPRSRIVAIREINDESALFFTQAGTQKMQDLGCNTQCSLTFWLPSTQRDMTLLGNATALTEDDNRAYWATYPPIPQLRFHSYAPTSGQVIENKSVLTEKLDLLKDQYADQTVPFCPEYVGFRVHFHSVRFYHYRTDELSDVERYELTENGWLRHVLSP